jgi:23S rRNA pseudouridine955/2504/2580 synthase
MNGLRKDPEVRPDAASWAEIDDSRAGQRIDNFLLSALKGVPKTHIYQILRTGQVRVNSGRVAATYRLQVGDRVRIPPVRTARPAARPGPAPVSPLLSRHVLHEDESVLVLNKPAGVAAHGGSGVSRGVIEQLRLERPELRFLELVHRLDRDTSGVLLLAKKRSALTALHEQIRSGSMRKWYLTLVAGHWSQAHRDVQLPLTKFVTAAGERRVNVDHQDGMPSRTLFKLLRAYPGFALLEAELRTGRTHQIRVHLQHLGFPIAGDDKYGDFTRNRGLAKQGLKRMFLHAFAVELTHPASALPVRFEAPLPADLQGFLDDLERPADTASA